MNAAEEATTSNQNESISCVLKTVPQCSGKCDWSGPWKDQMMHFLNSHSSLIHHDSVVMLEPENPKVMLAYNDMFIAYGAYHKDELACIVMHACNCTTSYYYRCTLLSGNSNYGDIQSEVTPLFKKVKKFRHIRKHKHATRFTSEQLDCLKDAQGQNSIFIEILGPDCEGAPRREIPGPSNGGGKDDTSEEDKSSDEESPQKRDRSNLADKMNAACKICSTTEGGTQCYWKGAEEELEDHLMKSHGVMLGLTGHCIKDFERLAPLVNYEFLSSEDSFTSPPFIEYYTNRPANCIVQLEQNLCCSTIALPKVSWRYGWPPEMGDITYPMMWDEFRPPVTLYIPLMWKYVPVLRTYPCHVIEDSSELKQLEQKCPCKTSNRSSSRPNQMAYCALNFVPGRTGQCYWMGPSEGIYDHLFEKHQSLVYQNDTILLQIDQPRILCAYRDAFLCYISYHRGDVICVVLHACSCSKMFMYRCALLSEIEGYSEVDGNIRYVINTCKDYKWISECPDVTRFPRAVVQPRKNSSGKISVQLQIYDSLEPEQNEPPKSSPEYTNPWIKFMEESSGASKPSGFGPELVKSRASTSKVSTVNAPEESMHTTSSVVSRYNGAGRVALTSNVSTLHVPVETISLLYTNSPFRFITNYVKDVSVSNSHDREERVRSRSALMPFTFTTTPGYLVQTMMTTLTNGHAENETSTLSLKPLGVPVERLAENDTSTPNDSMTPSLGSLHGPEETMVFTSISRSRKQSSAVKALANKFVHFKEWVQQFKNYK